MSIGFRVRSVETRGAEAKRARMHPRILAVVTLAARQDTRRFVPYLDGDLARSADLASRPEQGQLIYDTRYARRQYYEMPMKTRATHPQARMRWFEYSKALNRRRWERAAKAESKRIFNGR